MSAVGDLFTKNLGKPLQDTELGFKFPMEWDQVVLDDLYQEIGAGWFLDGFIYLLGPAVEGMNRYLDDWAFLFGDAVSRQVIGWNAYGSLLVIEEAEDLGTVAMIGMIDTLNVRYFRDPNLDFMGLFGNWLPQKKLPGFLDDHVYQAYRAAGNAPLEIGEILGIIHPLSLDGKFELANFQKEPLRDYFSEVTKIYRNVGD
jgi:hypothetical protein